MWHWRRKRWLTWLIGRTTAYLRWHCHWIRSYCHARHIRCLIEFHMNKILLLKTQNEAKYNENAINAHVVWKKKRKIWSKQIIFNITLLIIPNIFPSSIYMRLFILQSRISSELVSYQCVKLLEHLCLLRRRFLWCQLMWFFFRKNKTSVFNLAWRLLFQERSREKNDKYINIKKTTNLLDDSNPLK